MVSHPRRNKLAEYGGRIISTDGRKTVELRDPNDTPSADSSIGVSVTASSAAIFARRRQIPPGQPGCAECGGHGWVYATPGDAQVNFATPCRSCFPEGHEGCALCGGSGLAWTGAANGKCPRCFPIQITAEQRAALALVAEGLWSLESAEIEGVRPAIEDIESLERRLDALRSACGYPQRAA